MIAFSAFGFSGLWFSKTDFSLPWVEWWILYKILRSLPVYALAEVYPKDLTVTVSTELVPALGSLGNFLIAGLGCVCVSLE